MERGGSEDESECLHPALQGEPMAHEERRRTPRIRVSVRAAYQDEGESKRGNVYDLGLGGVFICTSEPLDPGSHLCLTLETPGEEVPVEADGPVVWTNLVETEAVPAGMGIRFLRVDPMAQERLARRLEPLA